MMSLSVSSIPGCSFGMCCPKLTSKMDPEHSEIQYWMDQKFSGLITACLGQVEVLNQDFFQSLFHKHLSAYPWPRLPRLLLGKIAGDCFRSLLLSIRENLNHGGNTWFPTNHLCKWQQPMKGVTVLSAIVSLLEETPYLHHHFVMLKGKSWNSSPSSMLTTSLDVKLAPAKVSCRQKKEEPVLCLLCRKACCQSVYPSVFVILPIWQCLLSASVHLFANLVHQRVSL